MGKTFTVAEAARLIASKHEDIASVANQLRRLVQRRAVKTVGQSGSGRTAANLFSISDIATARLQRTLIALGISSDEVQQETAIACYYDNEAMRRVVEAVISDVEIGALSENWVFYLNLSVPGENGERAMGAKIADRDNAEILSHPALAALVVIPMREWLVELAKAAGN